MMKKKFDIDAKGKLIPYRKRYINNTTFDIEDIKNNNNFEVDYLIAETISILNKKGYETTTSCSGHILNYSLCSIDYFKNNIKEELNGDKYFVIYQHGASPFKYIIVPDTSIEYNEYINHNKDFLKRKEQSLKEDFEFDVCRIIKPVTSCDITFKNSIMFPKIPNGFYPQFSNNYRLMDNHGVAIKISHGLEDDAKLKDNFTNKKYTRFLKTINCQKSENEERRLDKDIEKDIIEANNELLKWAKSLSKIKN